MAAIARSALEWRCAQQGTVELVVGEFAFVMVVVKVVISTPMAVPDWVRLSYKRSNTKREIHASSTYFGKGIGEVKEE